MPHDSPLTVSAGSLGDMEAREEAQAADTGLAEQEAAAPEPEAVGDSEPLSPSSPGESGSGHDRLAFGTLRYTAPSYVITYDFMGASPSYFPHL